MHQSNEIKQGGMLRGIQGTLLSTPATLPSPHTGYILLPEPWESEKWFQSSAWPAADLGWLARKSQNPNPNSGEFVNLWNSRKSCVTKLWQGQGGSKTYKNTGARDFIWISEMSFLHIVGSLKAIGSQVLCPRVSTSARKWKLPSSKNLGRGPFFFFSLSLWEGA